VSAPHKYWRVYDEALERLQSRDLGERCAAAGFRGDRNDVEIGFLDRRYRLARQRDTLVIDNTAPGCPEEGIATADARSLSAEQQEEHLRDRILILHYLDRASGAPLTGSMVGFDQLSGARFYGGPFRGRVELPLVRAFASRPQRLVEIAQELGGCAAEYGDCSILLHPFPRVPLVFILWRGDDEVPDNGRMLWDASAESYLSAEDLTVLGETVLLRLKSRAAQLSAPLET